MTDSPEASEELSHLFQLLEQKQSPSCSFQIQQQFYQKGCEFFKKHPSCIWCKFTPIAVEMVHLYSLPPNPFTNLFDKLTTECLGSCSNCINAYHKECPELLKRLEEVYEEDALALFAKTLYAKTTTRLSSVLQGYIDGTIPHNNQKLLYGLFEILEFPLCLGDPGLNRQLSRVMQSLIDSRKMLKVTKVMPGVIVLAFHEDGAVRVWALNVLGSKLQPATNWHPELVGLNEAIARSSRFLTEEERHKSAYHVLYWVPNEELCYSNQWIVPLLASIHFEDHYSLLMLCIALDRMSKLPRTERLGLRSLTDFAKTLFKSKNLFAVINKNAVFPLQAPDSILGYSFKVCVTQWIRLFCNLACMRKDGALLEFLVGSLIEGFSTAVTSHDARNNIISLLINVVHFCTTSEDLKDDHFYSISVRKTLEFLTRYFLQHSHPHQSNPLLLETCKTCIQFDCNELCTVVSGSGDVNLASHDALFELITKILVQFSEDPSLFELMLGVCVKLFVEAEGDLFLLALKTRREYLNYLVRSWPLLSPPTVTESNHASLLLFAQTLSDSSFPSDFLSAFTKHNAISLATFPSTFTKKIKSIESMPDLVHSGLVKMAAYLEEVFVPLTCHRGSDAALLEKAPNALYLKLHLISSTSLMLYLISSIKSPTQDMPLWRAFYSSCHTLSLLIEFLGLDALKQCLRENPGMAKRFKYLSQWMHYFGKYCSVLDPARAKSLGLFVRDMLVLAVSTDTLITGLDRYISAWMATFRIDHGMTVYLKPAVIAYEEKFRVQLNVKFPLAEPAPSTHASVPAMGIEEMFLQRLKEEAGQSSRPLRIGHPMNVAPSLTQSVKPTTKLGQLRQDLVREILPVKPVRNKTNAAVHHTAKAIKLDVHGDAHSSDVEESHSFVDTFKDGLAMVGNTTSGKETGRSVKLISLADVGGADTSGKSATRFDDYVEIDPQAHIKKLHKYLLDLDIDSINDRSLEGTNAKPIPDIFESSKEYAEIFEPLLLFECRSQLLQAKADLDSAACFSVKVLAISNVDDYHEVTVGAEGDENSRLLSEHDYIMARLDQREAKSQIVGMVTQASFKGSRTEATVRFKFKPHQHQYQVELRVGLVWKVKKLCNWVTNIREFSALHSIHDLRLSKSILKPIMAPVEDAQLADVATMLERSLELNESQAQAIAVALNNPNPFTLIQGPPGTGKTKTILGLVGALFGRPFPSLTSKLRPQRLLICAPSNAAIDEIVRRLKAGIYDCYHQKFSPKILRLGSHEMIHEDVKDLTLDATIERTFNQQCKESLALLQQQRESVADMKRDLDYAEKAGASSDQLQKMKQNLWQLREAMKKNTGFIEGTRQSLRNKVVTEAQVVCSTLSSSGIDLLSKLQFDVVIIDEACQAVEISALIPLQYGCKTCILVGDPNQLPPTVISQAASVFAYEQSLFQRIQKSNPEAVQLLSIQYRMHPDISLFPNRYFYNGRLTDGPQNTQLNARPWHFSHLLAPYRFYDIHGKERNQVRKSGDQGTSKSNELEARACASLVAYLCNQASDYNFANKIGIVTPYKEQRRTLKRELRRRFGPDIDHHLEISTVDGYQGQEKEIIIFSCVRTCESRGIGFLNDARRLNVALTRAKCSLFILGRSDTLARNLLWGELIKDAKERKAFISYDERFWDMARELRPMNMYPPRNQVVEEKPPAPEPVAFKIKTPMQRKREGTSADPIAPSANNAVDLTEDEPPKKKPLLLDALLEKINNNNS